MPSKDLILDKASCSNLYDNFVYGSYVLDLCCGPGFVAKVIREKIGDEGKLVGIDHSPSFVEYARGICPFKNVIFKCGNVENLDRCTGGQKFDFVILLASW